MKKITLILSTTLLLISSLSLQAKPNRFEKWDTNGDGMVAEAEFVSRAKKSEKAAKRFKRFDKDGDGYLSQEEVSDMPKGKKKNKKKNKKDKEETKES